MANTRTQDVTISRRELERLRRDSLILDWLESEVHVRCPGRPAHREVIGGLIDAGRSVDEVVDRHVKRLEARKASAPRPDREPSRSRAS